MSLPPNWATLQQPPPRNHGIPAIDALRPGQPLRELVGEMLADAAIERAEKIGKPTYGSLLTANNGRNQPVEILQELADTPGAFVAWLQEIGSLDDDHAFSESEGVQCAMQQLNDLTWTINSAAKYRAKRLAKAKGETP
jgi:hypothetical protein